MLLLEVMIAIALVTLCLLPLITPHLAMFKEQSKFNTAMQLDHVVHLLYVDMLEQMYLGKISWKQVQEKRPVPIDDNTWSRIGQTSKFPFEGHYLFGEIKHKEGKDTEWGVYLLTLTFVLSPKNAKEEHSPQWVFPYQLCAAKHTIKAQETEQPEEAPPAEKAPPKKKGTP